MKEISILIQHHAGPTGKVLVCKKPGGAWEFPKGRVRTNETGPEAAGRVAWEALGMEIVPGKLSMLGHKNPQDGTVEHIPCGNITHNTNTKCDYHCYYEAVDKWQTEPKAGAYAEFRWVHPSELAQVEFAGDDVDFMKKYDPWLKGEYIPNARMD